MERDLLEAVVIDLAGLIFYGGILSQIVSPPLGLSSRHLMFLGLVFPLIAYIVTYRRYEEQFWTAFIGSLLAGLVMLLGGLWLILNTVI